VTTTESTTSTTPELHPGLNEALAKLPQGYRFVLRDRRDGEMKAYRDQSSATNVTGTAYRMFTQTRGASGTYSGCEWEMLGYNTPDYTAQQVHLDWLPVPVPEPMPAKPAWWTGSIVRLVQARPAQVTVIIRDRNDGELRGFRSEEDYGEYWNAWHVDDGWHRLGSNTETIAFYLAHNWERVDLRWADPEPEPVTTPVPDWFDAEMHAAVGNRPGAVECIVWRRGEGLRGFRSTGTDLLPDHWRKLPGQEWEHRDRDPRYGLAAHVNAGWSEVDFGWGLPPAPVAEPTPEQARIAALELRVSELNNTIADQRRQINNATQILERFKEQVQEVATRYAKNNGWCSVVDEALEELGLSRMEPKTYTATLHINVDFTFTPESYSEDGPSDSEVEEMIQTYDLKTRIERYFSMSGVNSSSVDDVNFDVNDVSEE
jgi:hypothetical protein